MKVTFIPIVIGALGTNTKELIKGLEDEWRPSKLLHHWDWPDYWKESWRLEETCSHSNSSERLSANADVKNSQGANSKSKIGDLSQGWPEGSLFKSYYTKVLGREQHLSLDCSTLLLIPTLYCWVLSKEASSTIFWVFGKSRPGIEH